MKPWTAVRVAALFAVTAGLTGCGGGGAGSGPYFGQTPPGREPVPFAPKILGESVAGLSIASDGQAIYWSERGGVGDRGRILCSRRQGDRWSEPEVVDIGPLVDPQEPAVSSDGLNLVFTAVDPNGPDGGARVLWWATRAEDGTWSVREAAVSSLDGFALCGGVSVDVSGNLYFDAVPPLGRDANLYVSHWSGRTFQAPLVLTHPLVSEEDESTPFMAPDAGYLLYSLRHADGSADLVVSFSQRFGPWSNPASLGLRDGTELLRSPYVSPDGAYLFYVVDTGSTSTVYWVSAAVIEQQRPAGW